MSASLKVAGVVCLSLVGENAAFTLSSAPAVRLAIAQQSAMSLSARPLRVSTLRMQQQQVDADKKVEATDELSDLVGINSDEEKMVKGSSQNPDETPLASAKDENWEEISRSSAEVRQSVTETRKKGSSAPEENIFVTTAVKFGALSNDSPLVTSELVGNKGFDPLNLAKDDGLLRQYREAELKHGRLAMLASVGWVFSELLHPGLASFLKKPSFLAKTASGVQEKAPSVLNGGLENVPLWMWGVIVVVSGVFEVGRMLAISEEPTSFKPGALGFDPMNFYKLADAEEKEALDLKEVNNGRLAMIAIATFAAKEFLFDAAIVNQSPELFTKGPLSYAISIPSLLLQYTGLFSCQTGLTYCAQGDTDVIKAIMSTSDAGVAEQADYINSIMSTNLFL